MAVQSFKYELLEFVRSNPKSSYEDMQAEYPDKGRPQLINAINNLKSKNSIKFNTGKNDSGDVVFSVAGKSAKKKEGNIVITPKDEIKQDHRKNRAPPTMCSMFGEIKLSNRDDIARYGLERMKQDLESTLADVNEQLKNL